MDFLILDCNYPKENVRLNTYKYAEKTYDRVEAMSDGAVIQAFIIMKEQDVRDCDKFPFYRTYYQRNTFGYNVPPACNIAAYDEKKGKWSILSANDCKKELTSPNFLNYDKAVERFRKRFSYCGNEELAKSIKRLSFSFLSFILLYCITYLLSLNDLFFGVIVPMGETTIWIFVLILVLLWVPPLIPYIKSVYLKDVGIDLIQREESRC